MTYKELLTDMGARTGLHTEMIHKVLYHLPDSLLLLEIGETVKTTLGWFHMTESKGRVVILPDGKSTSNLLPKVVVRLKPGPRLKVLLEEDETSS